MRKTIFISLMMLMPVIAYALPVECVGLAKQIVNGNDTLFFFSGNIDMRSTIGEAEWHSIETGSVETGVEMQYNMDEGGYYIVKDGVEYSPFYVFRYVEPENLNLELTPDCAGAVLRLTGDTKPYTYKRRDGSEGVYMRACTIDYNVLVWNGETWADSAVQMINLKLREGLYNLEPLYDTTQIALCYDTEIRATLFSDSACLTTELLENEVKSVNMELTSLATVRGVEGEKSNERNRPTSQRLISASEYSGPLEVAFYSNPTPAVQFYKWAIYKSSQCIVTRHDKDIRYTFSEPGSYRVVCTVNNASCTADSMEMRVTISESYLRVPNVFTPNGDGVNDEFRVSYRSLREFHCWVYNRWGKLVYEWTDPAKGWDGTVNGRPAAEGAYYYVVRAMGTDAAKDASYIGLKATYNSRKRDADESVIGIYQLSGDINLLRGKKN